MNHVIQTIPVRTNPPYEVLAGPGLLGQCGRILGGLLKTRRVAVVTDSTVAPLYLDTVRDSLTDAGFSVCAHVFPAGEANKTIPVFAGALEFLARERLTRSDCILALGGGVTGDMAGFAAAVYLRGIQYVQLPTTLLAALDSSVGGKTAIDLESGKNLAGAFLQPVTVLCDTDCLRTLPAPVFADGIAEAVKTGILCDESLFSLFEAGTPEPVSVIARCVAYKAGVVERDEREQNERRLLNLGHTVGHAVEKCGGYAVSHGHAVAAGLGVIARAAERLGWTEEPIADRIARCLIRNHLPADTEFGAEELASAALSDKKRAGDTITLIIPKRIGLCEMKPVPVGELPSIFRAGLEHG